MRNCVKRKKYGRNSRTNLLLLLWAYFFANLFTVDSRRVVPAR